MVNKVLPLGYFTFKYMHSSRSKSERLYPMQLDEALDFNGNILFGAVGNACIGCTAWQKCFNVMARWSLTLACMGQCFCWAPWAFEGSIATLHNAKGAPRG